jgi:tetratricopeptide (TPR) repeat protein
MVSKISIILTVLLFLVITFSCVFAQSADEWNEKGCDLGDQGKHQEAIKCFDKAIEIEPNDIDAWNGKGNALYCLGKYDEAIRCYDKALDIDPNDTDVWYNKGNALNDKEKYEKAIKGYNKYLEINPNNAEAKSYKEKALKALGKTPLVKKENYKMNPIIILGLVFCAPGIYFVYASIFNWKLLRRLKSFNLNVKMWGLTRVRIIYAILGIIFTALGIFIITSFI